MPPVIAGARPLLVFDPEPDTAVGAAVLPTVPEPTVTVPLEEDEVSATCADFMSTDNVP
jgi:hypothetical protein